MNTVAAKTENNVLSVSLRVTPQEFAAALPGAYLDNAERYVVPGYAAGLAPRAALERVYGRGVLFDEALDRCIPQIYGRFLKEKGFRAIGKPRVTEVAWLPEGGASFAVEADLYPEAELGEYRGIRTLLRREDDEAAYERAVLDAACCGMKAEVTAAMVELKLDSMAAQEKLNVFGDAIYHLLADIVDILAKVYRDTGSAIPMNQIHTEAMDVVLEMVSGNGANPSREFLGVRMRDMARRYRDLPDDFDNLLDAAIEARRRKKNAMSTEELAGDVFKAYIGSLGLDEKTWREERGRQAAAAARVDMLLDAVARAEGLEATDEEIETALAKIAGQCGLDIAQVRAEVDAEPVVWQILIEKARKLILGSAVALTPADRSGINAL